MADRISAARDYVAKKPQDRFGLYTLAMELRKAREFEECYATFDRLLTHYPDYGPGLYHYARARQEAGDLPGARALLDRGMPLVQGRDDKTWREMRDLREALDLLEE